MFLSGRARMMREQLFRAMKNGRILEIVYQAKDGTISQRDIRVLNIKGEGVLAFCYLRGMKRVFQIDQILAAYPAKFQQRRIG